MLAQYVVRTILVVVCAGIAVAVPTIVPFVSLIGAFCFSIIGLLLPICIEMLTFYEKGFGRFNWKLIKNVIVAIMAMIALIFGSKAAIEDIVDLYTPKNSTDNFPVEMLALKLNDTISPLLNATGAS